MPVRRSQEYTGGREIVVGTHPAPASNPASASAAYNVRQYVCRWRPRWRPGVFKEMGELFTPTHLVVLAIVAIVLFGGKKLPELGKGLGEGLRGFKEGMKGISDEPAKPGETAHTVTPKTADQTPKPPTA